MIRLLPLQFIVFSLQLLLVPPFALSETTINWYRPDFPPTFILSGEEKGTGYGDLIQRDVIASLESFNHVLIESNYKRIVRALRTGGNVCCPSIYKTREREQFSVYSEPLFIGLSNGIILDRKRLEKYRKYIVKNGEIDLFRLLTEKKNVRLGVLLGRNYGESIERAIAPFRQTDMIQERSKHDFNDLFKVMMRGRIDMILALPMEIAYTLQKAGVDSKDVQFFMVKKGKHYSTAYIACTKSPWGYTVIEEIDKVIENKRAVFATYYRDWLDEPSAEMYERLVKEVFDIDIPEKVQVVKKFGQDIDN